MMNVVPQSLPCVPVILVSFYLCECRALALPLVFLCSLSSLQVSMVERRLGSFFWGGTPGSSFMSSQIHHICLNAIVIPILHCIL